jgi:hypothetical protein
MENLFLRPAIGAVSRRDQCVNRAAQSITMVATTGLAVTIIAAPAWSPWGHV